MSSAKNAMLKTHDAGIGGENDGSAKSQEIPMRSQEPTERRESDPIPTHWMRLIHCMSTIARLTMATLALSRRDLFVSGLPFLDIPRRFVDLVKDRHFPLLNCIMNKSGLCDTTLRGHGVMKIWYN